MFISVSVSSFSMSVSHSFSSRAFPVSLASIMTVIPVSRRMLLLTAHTYTSTLINNEGIMSASVYSKKVYSIKIKIVYEVRKFPKCLEQQTFLQFATKSQNHLSWSVPCTGTSQIRMSRKRSTFFVTRFRK